MGNDRRVTREQNVTAEHKGAESRWGGTQDADSSSERAQEEVARQVAKCYFQRLGKITEEEAAAKGLGKTFRRTDMWCKAA